MGEKEKKTFRLGEFVTLKRGYDLPAQARSAGTYPIVSSSGISGSHGAFKVEGPGVVTGRYGTLGEVFYIPGRFWPLNTSLYVQDFKGNDPKFVYYYLQTVLSANFNAAGAVPGVNRNILHKLSVPKPPKAQRKIAAVLSAYDDLIENNKRRIVALEKMAEEIYREWFVRLRFPGYEKSKFAKGMPSEWDIMRAKEIVDRKRFGKIYQKNDLLQDGTIVVIDQSRADWLGFYNGKPEHVASPEEPVILFGDHTCKMVLMTKPFSLAENVIPFRPKNGLSSYFLFHLVKDLAETTEYKRHWTVLITKEVLIPEKALQFAFERAVKRNHEEAEALRQANRLAGESRDLLLPRLISGKLSVEDLDIRFPPSMQQDATAD